MSPFVVLSVGADRTLLRLRDQVLRAAGYDVQECYVPRGCDVPIEAQFDIVIFCHTVRDEDKRRIIRAIRTSKPSVPIMVVRANGVGAESVDASVHSLDGPKVLLQCVRELLGTQPRS